MNKFTGKEIKQMLINVPTIDVTKNKSMFENINWVEQKKGVDNVMDNLQNWDTSKKTSFENLGKNNLK